MIAALAGRRIDAPDAENARFPLEMKEIVYGRIRDFFRERKVKILVSSAACGADLLAQKAARELNIEQHIILPFAREKFRKTSVTDRPGDWGKLFDEICAEVELKGNLLVLQDFKDDEEKAYSAVTIEILNLAESLRLSAAEEQITAIAVWDGKAKAENDETASFIEKSKMKDFQTKDISTK
jgi:hypothetical protein